MIDKNNMEEVDCPTCGNKASKALIYQREDGIGFYQCANCNIEFASPRLAEEELLKLYEGDDWKALSSYEKWTYEDWKSNKGLHYHLIQQNLDLIKRFLQPGSSVLDVGCDIGLTVRALEDYGYHSEGVEVSSVGAKIAKEKTRIKVHNMELGDYKGEVKFDGILLLDVLEHLYSPVQVLKDCAANMNKDGHLFIHVPHHNGLSTRFKKFLHKKGLKTGFKHFGFPAHIYAFDKKSLRIMLGKSGFKVTHYESWPSTLTNGKVNIFNYLFVHLIKKLTLSDYIICVAKKM